MNYEWANVKIMIKIKSTYLITNIMYSPHLKKGRHLPQNIEDRQEENQTPCSMSIRWPGDDYQHDDDGDFEEAKHENSLLIIAWWSAVQMRWAMYPLLQLSPTWVQQKYG